MTNLSWMVMIVATISGAASAAWFEAPADPHKLQEDIRAACAQGGLIARILEASHP